MTGRPITVRDAVHGDIALSAEEAAVMDTLEFQRLRRIKQLGTSDLIYPTAVHTRFDHSLGTLQMAQRMVDSLRARGHEIREEDARHIRLAALLHDVTHVPFGHTFEDERKLFERHDQGFRVDHYLRSPESELAQCLERLGLAQPIYQMLSPKRRDTDPPFKAQIVSSTLDADLFDYIRRDLMFTGLRQNYDERIFSYFALRDGALVLDLEKNGVIRADGLSETLNLLRLRYTLAERVYYHHTKAATAAMLSKAVECAQGLEERDLLYLGDDALLSKLETDWATDSTRRLVGKLRRRQLYKRAYQLTYESVGDETRVARLIQTCHESREARAESEKALAEGIGLDPAKAPVIIYCPEAKMYFKEAAVQAILPGDHVLALTAVDERNPARGELELLQSKYRNLWSFYVFLDGEHIGRRVELAQLAEARFGCANAYRP